MKLTIEITLGEPRRDSSVLLAALPALIPMFARLFERDEPVVQYASVDPFGFPNGARTAPARPDGA